MKDFLGKALDVGDAVVFVDTAHIETIKHAKILGFEEYPAGWFAKIRYGYMYGALTGTKEFPCRLIIKIDPKLSKVQ